MGLSLYFQAMKQFLSALILCSPFFSLGQTVSVYVNDTTFVNETVVLSGTDSTNGKITAVYPAYNNAPAYEVNYYYGYKSGFVKILYPGTSQLMRTIVYAKGQYNGENTWYNQEGKIVIKGMYLNGAKDGFWIYKNLAFMGSYKKGLKHGKWTWIGPDGRKQKAKFKKGKLKHKRRGEVVLPTHIPKTILMDGVVAL